MTNSYTDLVDENQVLADLEGQDTGKLDPWEEQEMIQQMAKWHTWQQKKTAQANQQQLNQLGEKKIKAVAEEMGITPRN
jgi:Fe-S cluster biosynthesis and repair protein YggX